MDLASAKRRLLALKAKRQAVEQAIDALRRVKAAYREGAELSATRTLRDVPRSRGSGDDLAAGRPADH